MKSRLSLPEEALREIFRCFRCGFCRSACPTFAIMGTESWNARGRLMLAREIIEGHLEPEQAFLDRIFSCNSCRACEVVCPAIVEVVDALTAFKSALVASGVEPPERILKIREAIVEHGSPFARERGEPEVEGGAEVLVFPGCVAMDLEPGVLRAVETILEAAGISYSVLEGPCCGAPLRNMGFEADAKGMARRLVSKIEASGAERVITPCPACLSALKPHLGPRVEHTTTFIRGLLREGRLVLKRKVELRATYHDPCVLGRWLGVYEAPRELIWLSGLELVEMPRSRANSACCGYGFLNFMAYPELAREAAKRRVAEALDLGADVLLTACPTCLHALSEAAREVARALAVSDLAEVVAELVAR